MASPNVEHILIAAGRCPPKNELNRDEEGAVDTISRSFVGRGASRESQALLFMEQKSKLWVTKLQVKHCQIMKSRCTHNMTSRDALPCQPSCVSKWFADTMKYNCSLCNMCKHLAF
jgi:hypothetical protein